MKSFFSFLFSKKFPNAQTRDALAVGPLTATRALLYALGAAFLVIVYALIVQLNDTLLVTVPARGGTITEGIIGAPRFINPVLAATDTDRALTRLVFAGVMKEYGDGTLVPELAESFTISPDGRTYTFTLREKLFFHDGSVLTSSDVAFTIEKLKNPVLNARGYSYWQDITVSTPNQHTVIVTLLAPEESFLRQMTIGILSSAQWQGVADEAFADPSLNISPIGAGAFSLVGVSTDALGAPKKLVFSRNKHYALATPLLDSLNVLIFANQSSLLTALESGEIDMTMDLAPQSVLQDRAPSNITIAIIPETNSVRLYRRAGESAFGNASLLAIVNRYVDKEAIVATVENGYGIPFTPSGIESADERSILALEEAEAALKDIGYTVKDGVLTSKGGNPVQLGIATANDTRLLAAARALQGQLAALGIISEVQVFDQGTFQDELAAHAFPLVLLGRGDALPSGYEQAIPLYTIAHLAAFDEDARGIVQATLGTPELRYATVQQWHTRTDRLWKWFVGKKQISKEDSE